MAPPRRSYLDFFDTSITKKKNFLLLRVHLLSANLQVSVFTAPWFKSSHNAKSQEESRKTSGTQTLNYKSSQQPGSPQAHWPHSALSSTYDDDGYKIFQTSHG
jgi:hypothetical protein